MNHRGLIPGVVEAEGITDQQVMSLEAIYLLHLCCRLSDRNRTILDAKELRLVPQ
jgi:hypothetical protein